jgi:hypothetical protein
MDTSREATVSAELPPRARAQEYTQAIDGRDGGRRERQNGARRPPAPDLAKPRPAACMLFSESIAACPSARIAFDRPLWVNRVRSWVDGANARRERGVSSQRARCRWIDRL